MSKKVKNLELKTKVPTYGVYLDEETRAALDLEIARRCLEKPDLKGKINIQKLVVACVREIIGDKKLRLMVVSV